MKANAESGSKYLALTRMSWKAYAGNNSEGLTLSEARI